MEKLQKSMSGYIKAISKRNEGEDKEKTLPVGRLGGSMISHGEDFEENSEFGQCLTGESMEIYVTMTKLLTTTQVSVVPMNALPAYRRRMLSVQPRAGSRHWNDPWFK